MAIRRDRDRPPPHAELRVGPGLSGIVVGPDAPVDVVRRSSFRVGPGDGAGAAVTLSARAFVVEGPARPHYSADSEEITVPFPDGTDTQAIVYYPMTTDGQIAETPGGWPWIAFMHGLTPEEIWGGYGANQRSMCDQETDEPFDLFRRWASTQRALAQLGYVSISPNRGLANVVHWFRETRPWSALVDRERLALVGHSDASFQVVLGAPDMAAVAVAVLGPRADITPRGPCLVVGSTSDSNLGTLEAYASSSTPKHLLLLDSGAYSHYAYYDGLCGADDDHVPAATATRQRRLTLRALTGFFDGYLTDAEVPPDLGIAADELGVEDVCWDLGDGNVGGRCD